LQQSLVSGDVSVGALLMAKTVSCRQSIFWFTKRVVLADFFARKACCEWTILPGIIVWLITTSNSQQLTRFAAERCHFLKRQCPTVQVAH